jgi:parvulin-like peptidyl-prolyl isomerase
MSRSLLVVLACAAAFGASAGEPFAVVRGPRGAVTTSLFSDQNAQLPVARVEDQTVTLQQFSQALSAAHGAHDADEKAGKADFRPVLDRLIGARLIALEAHDMGLDDSPALQRAINEFSAKELRRAMLRKLLDGVGPDPARVDLYFREAVREWKVDSLLFAQEPAAKKFSQELKQGKEFGALAAQAVAAKEAVRNTGDYASAAKMLPQVAAVARDLFAGQVSEPVQVQGGWAVFRVVDIRDPENATARQEAVDRATTEAREEAMKQTYPKLLAKYARVDRKLLARLDFEAKKPGFGALSKDERVLASIKGGTDIRVKDLSKEIAKGFFHGIDDAIRQKRVNEQKDHSFENLLRGAVLGQEAVAQKIAQSPDFKAAVTEHRDGLVFGEFVQKVVLPGLEIKEDEGRAYYDAHKADFALPAFYALDTLSFSTAKAAQSAASKLRDGTDFKWLQDNAEGRVSGDKALALSGSTVSATALPESLRKQLGDARVGDVKAFESDGLHHVAVIRRIVPQNFRPYLEVRAEIAKKLSGEKVNRALAEWVAKLRKAHDVEVYLQQIGT